MEHTTGDPTASTGDPAALTAADSAQVSVVALRSAFVHAPTGIAVLTMTGVVAGANPALGQVLRREVAELVGDTLFGVTHPADLPAARANCAAINAGTVSLVREECRFLLPGGAVVWARVSTSRVEAHADQPAHLVMHVEDISEQKALEARLLHQALHDPLTGLGNRALLDRRVAADLTPGPQPEREAGDPVCGLVLLDLDGFKALNDAYGHLAGDAALIAVGDRVRALLGPGEVAVRLGGDEFAVWCPLTTTTQVAQLVVALREAVAVPLELGSGTALLTASLGSATHSTSGGPGGGAAPPLDGVTQLLRTADGAMYADKRRLG